MEAWRAFLAAIRGESVDLIGPYFAPTRQSFRDPVIFVDSGAKFRQGREGFSVGDSDSFDGKLDLTLPHEKDFSDLAFVLYGLPENVSHVRLLGFLGGRRDHEILNLGEVHHFLKRRKRDARAEFDSEILAYSAGSWKISLESTFSFAVFERATVCIHGDVRYPIGDPQEVPPLSSLGLSNVASGQVGVHSSQPFFIFR